MTYDHPRIQVLLDEDGVRVVVLSGEFDVDSVGPLAQVLADAAREGVRRVVDIARVTFADSSLLNILLAGDREDHLIVAGPVPEQFAQLLRLFAAEMELEIAPTLAEARGRSTRSSSSE
ncbi:anti-sigma factor antagonist [Streptomyces cirratus]|uniref:Anti-sigma factor antagonist n=1 Tax=Streptomyces cirratus TaxID=68187 RepID=A0ABQ3ESE5_9ACTN|nr:STAS domain-containing protein [Streptomyces cirratus]GHB56090.1 anti-sigma factor antagonist [Streptomyces cirratus]